MAEMRLRYILALGLGGSMLLTWLTAWLWVVVLASSRHNLDKCPGCRSKRVRRSWPTTLDKVFSVSAICAFRCEACLKRFYARDSLWNAKSQLAR